MRIKIEVVHLIKGRARIKVESAYDPGVFFMIIDAILQEIEEIRKAEVNRYAKSITIYFKDKSDLSVILEKLKSILLQMASEPSFEDRLEEILDSMKYAKNGSFRVVLDDKALAISRTMDNTVKSITESMIEMKTVVPATAFVAGIATLALAPYLPTPTWLVLLAFSFTSFNQMNSLDSNAHSQVNSLPENRSFVRRIETQEPDPQIASNNRFG